MWELHVESISFLTLARTEQRGCHACGNCVICKGSKEKHGIRFLIEGSYFIGSKTGYRYEIQSGYTCDSNYIVYMLICAKCGVQSVGSTWNFKTRFSQHKRD
eukprot:533397_1